MAALLAATSAFAQSSTDFKSLLSGSGQPSSIKVAEMPETFKAARIKVGGSSASGGGLGDMMGLMMFGMMSSLGSLGGGSGNQPPSFLTLLDVSWTDGSVVSVSGSDFLVTYGIELDMMEMAAQPKAVPAMKLKLLRTSAINSFQPLPELTKAAYLKAMEDMTKDRPADSDTAAPIRPEVTTADDPKSETISRAKQAVLGMMMYLSDFDDQFPYVQGSQAAHFVTYPYVKNKDIFMSMNPLSPTRFLFNINLGGVQAGDIEEPARTPLYIDAKPWPDGGRVVGYSDGHVKYMPAESWADIENMWKRKWKRTAKVPLPASTGEGFQP